MNQYLIIAICFISTMAIVLGSTWILKKLMDDQTKAIKKHIEDYHPTVRVEDIYASQQEIISGKGK